jgi:DNA-directed RNA polymerase specialized sigma subunit
MRKLTRKQQKDVLKLKWVVETLARRAYAKKHSGNAATLDDITQVAWYAACVAVHDYNPNKGMKLSTYAWQRVVAYIGHFYRDKTRAIRIPRAEQTLYYKIIEQTSKNVPKEKVCEMLSITMDKLEETLKVGVMEPGPLFDDTHEVQSDYTPSGVPTIGTDLSDRDLNFLISYTNDRTICEGGKNLRQCNRARKQEQEVRDQLKNMVFTQYDFEMLYNGTN